MENQVKVYMPLIDGANGNDDEGYVAGIYSTKARAEQNRDRLQKEFNGDVSTILEFYIDEYRPIGV